MLIGEILFNCQLNFKYYYLKIYIHKAVKLCDKYEFT